MCAAAYNIGIIFENMNDTAAPLETSAASAAGDTLTTQVYERMRDDIILAKLSPLSLIHI